MPGVQEVFTAVTWGRGWGGGGRGRGKGRDRRGGGSFILLHAVPHWMGCFHCETHIPFVGESHSEESLPLRKKGQGWEGGPRAL